MKTFLISLLGLFAPLSVFAAEVTIEQCEDWALDNYPLVKQYRLIEQMQSIELSDVNKAWLPRVDVYAQATVQNKVPGFPESMQPMLQQLGVNLPGLRKDQYRVGAEISQTIWDGGKGKTDRESYRAEAASRTASNDVELYAVRERVQDLYFAILLTDAQIEQSQLMVTQIDANLTKLRAMLRCGTVMQSDVDVVEAQSLTVQQNIKRLNGMRDGYRRALEIFVGQSLEGKTFVCPSEAMPTDMECRRPELAYFDAQKRYNDSRLALVKVSTMPRIGFFAQGYYGYPGYDYFGSMSSRTWTFNVMAGIKASWSIDAFYNKKNNKTRLALGNESIDTNADVFRLNNAMLSAQQQEDIRSRRALTEDDQRIVALRTSVRKAAEAKLDNGVIDTTDLLDKITDESTAAVNASYHRIELIRAIYKLKYILNQ